MTTLVALAFIFFGCPYFLMYAWNAIAAGFGLPQFGYWVAFSITTLYLILKASTNYKKKEKE